MGRAADVLERLLKRAQLHRNDPNLLAGLVHACRYCGLLEASAAAHELAVRLDPHIRTSVGHTYLQLGEFQKTLECGTADLYAKAYALEALGRRPEAIECDLEIEKNAGMEQLRLLAVCDRARLQGDRVTSLQAIDRALHCSGPFVNDPESHYWVARLLALLGEHERSVEHLAGTRQWIPVEPGLRAAGRLPGVACLASAVGGSGNPGPWIGPRGSKDLPSKQRQSPLGSRIRSGRACADFASSRLITTVTVVRLRSMPITLASLARR
jgi:hypothetical protein